MNRDLTVSGIFTESWESFRENIKYVYYLLAPALVISFVSIFVFAGDAHYTNLGEVEAGKMLVSFILGIVGIILGILATISLLFFFRSKNRDTYNTWKQYLRLLPKYIVVCILQGLMILAGLILLIIPGIYLAVRYAFVSYRTLEHPTESIQNLFAAEAKATEGNRVTILLIGLIVFIIALVWGMLTGGLLAGIFGAQGQAVADFLFELVVMPFFTVVSILTYLKLTGAANKEAVEAVVAEQAEKTPLMEKESEAKPATAPVVEPVV